MIARLWGERFAKASGQPVIVENRPGASTIIATQAVATAPADGQTLLYTINNTFSINPFVFKKLPYKADDFVPVIRILSVPYVLVVSSESKIRTLQDLVREAKARPGSMTYASAGIGSGFHVVTARLLNQAGISMTHVPYKDYFMPDVTARNASTSRSTPAPVRSPRSRAARCVRWQSRARTGSAPCLTSRRSPRGTPGSSAIHGMASFAPKGTPEDVVRALVSQSQRIVDAADFQAALLDYALTPIGGTSEAFRQFLVEDARAWAKVVKDNNITLE